DAAALRGDLGRAGVLPGELSPGEREVRHAVGAARLLRVEPPGGVEPRHLSGDVHDEIRRVEVLDLPHAVAPGGQSLAEVLDAGPDRRDRPDAGDDDTTTISH